MKKDTRSLDYSSDVVGKPLPPCRSSAKFQKRCGLFAKFWAPSAYRLYITAPKIQGYQNGT